MSDQLLEFVRTGSLRSISVGAPIEQVVASLGLPPDRSVSGKPEVWKYGALQLTVVDRAVRMIAVYFHGEALPWEPEICLCADPGDEARITSSLKKSSTPCVLEPFLSDDTTRTYVVTGSGAQVVIDVVAGLDKVIVHDLSRAT